MSKEKKKKQQVDFVQHICNVEAVGSNPATGIFLILCLFK